MLIKRGKIKIINIIENDEEFDDKKTKKVLKKAKQDAKNIKEAGNNKELNKESGN